MSKRILIIMLAGVNLLLLGVLIQTAQSPPQAIAQRAAEGIGAEGYLVITAKGGLHNETIYVLDAPNEMLHSFRTPLDRAAGVPARMAYVDTRDLSLDFSREALQP